MTEYSDGLLKTLSVIHYYLREGFYGTALRTCEGKEGNEAQIQVLKGVCLLLIGKSAEAMRILEAQRESNCSLGALHALKRAHSKAANPDKQSLREIESSLSTLLRDASDNNVFSAAEVLFFLGEPAKAKPFMEKIVKNSPDTPLFCCLLAWIEFSLGRDQKSTLDLFEKAMSLKYYDAFVGKMRILEGRHLAGDMKTVAKDALSLSFSHLPFHIESAKACLVAREWNNALLALQNSTIVETQNVYIQLMLTVHAICAAGSKIDPALNDLMTSLDDVEKDNHAMFGRIAGLLLRISALDRTVLTFAKSLLARANQLSRQAEYVVEELRASLGLEEAKEVSAKARLLMEMDSSDPYGALGVTIANLMAGKINDAAVQYSFLQESHNKISTTPIYHFIGSIIARHHNNSLHEFLTKIDSAIEIHLDGLQNIPFGLEFLKELDADFLFTVALQLMDNAPLAPVKTPDEALKSAERILTILIENCPGLSQAAFLIARAKYLNSDFEAADQMIELCLQENETIADAYLLRAQIRINKGLVTEADSCLTTGLSFNFSVKESALYHLIKAIVHKKKGEVQKAIDLLRAGLRLPQMERSTNLIGRRKVVNGHQIALQLELIDCLQIMKQSQEAESVMKEALYQWKGKPEEEQLILMNAQLHVNRGDPDTALAILSRVQPDQHNYQSARIKMAEIYLEEKKDKRMFTICYRELLKSSTTAAAYTLLGDAYMSVQEPENAIEVYELALKMQRKDLALTEKIGEAYVMCHLYSKAVNFYESVMNSSKDKKMRLKLADLLYKLGNTEKCIRILRQPLDEDHNPTDPTTISAHVQYLKLLADVQFAGGKHSEALNDLNTAKSLQMKLLTKTDSATNIPVKREISKICTSEAEIYSNQHEHKMVIEKYKEALHYYPTDIKTILSLASRYLTINRLNDCKQQCENALAIDKNNDEATLMVADMLYTNNDTDKAIVHFAQLLEKYPNHYHALARCLELAWRSGHVDQADKYLKKAIENNPRAFVDSGYNYCRGLHEWYSGEPNAALQAFNRARRDLEWGERSLYNMIEIVLNPDNEIIGGEILDHGDDRGDDADREMASKTAERFLKEVTFKNNNSKYILMDNSIMVASGIRSNVQKALDTLLPIIGPDGDKVASVGAVLVVARAYMLMKQTQKAKAILKRVSLHPWSLEDADYLEKCWLLLADLYINQNKTEQANTMLRTILSHNASSIKAFEFLGYLREKEQKFHDAAANYDDAWKLSRMRNPAIGYKLAYNLLKCKRLFDCVEVCHHVLKLYPTYPKIKKDIMDKARMNIRS